MKLLLGTKSLAKKEAVEIAFKKLNIKNYKIDTFKASSKVRENPIGEEIKVGAINRNNCLKEYIKENNLTYDMLISIEAGYTKEGDNYFLDTYTCISNKDKDYIGHGPRLKITETIFNFVEKQNMMHILINELLGYESANGVIGYITDNKVKRCDIESYSVIDALRKILNIKYDGKLEFEKYIFKDRLDKIENEINKKD